MIFPRQNEVMISCFEPLIRLFDNVPVFHRNFCSIFSHFSKKNDEKSKDEKSKKEGKTDIKANPLLTFTKDINPLIQKTCMPCHAESESNASELYFDSYESIFKGGKHGNPIIPGKGDSSMFVKKLLTNPPFGDQMPTPKRKPKLSEDQIKIFIEWINQGAKKN